VNEAIITDAASARIAAREVGFMVAPDKRDTSIARRAPAGAAILGFDLID
jgi:hypothetical protein